MAGFLEEETLKRRSEVGVGVKGVATIKRSTKQRLTYFKTTGVPHLCVCERGVKEILEISSESFILQVMELKSP